MPQDTKDIIAALPLAKRAVKMIVDRFQTHSRYLSPDLRIRVLAGSSSCPRGRPNLVSRQRFVSRNIILFDAQV